jgi:hypothetical protein
MKHLILYSFIILLSVSACKPTKSITTTNVSSIDLSEKRLFLLTYDTPMTQSFIISFKNYLAKELSEHHVIVEKYNILSSEKEKSIEDANKVKMQFKPDNILIVKVLQERGRDFYTMTKTVKKLREVTLLLELKNAQSENLYWSATINVNHIFETDQISESRDLSKNIIAKMQKDLIIK